MHSPPSSRVQKAREELAGRLREIRKDAGIGGRELALRCGWSESKSSRVENAKTPPSDADVRAWCRACAADEQAPDLIAANRLSADAHVQWPRLQRSGLRRLQESTGDLYQETRTFRTYVSDVIPGFLQTPGYAAALLSSIADFRGTPDDVSDAVAARMRRNEVLSNGARRFSFVMEESVLRYRLCSAETMAAQLGHLLGVMDLQNVAVGFIPFSARRAVWPMPTFTIFDDTRVHADTLDAAATLTQPGQVELYARAFERLAQGAVRGAAARSLVADAVASLA
ncbi:MULTISPECIES: helix-turn-helix domain-containing protein [Streptomyces]|uniref:helix-turn-helix domain-containing protein n=1 Tax=Streptomyces TaxID=1883 RepID=UPI001BEA797E|nr:MULTISPECIES: helix-turn-helix transcriptional regulator [unclassified Streptomyces]MBT2876464.1 helix-turn-helix domain-containing protein [Streptomyces sp. McG6]MBT2883028.1 helix-turn-helix domain-containing protein [Streptomyces sp. McG5]MBT2891016.1 helix-turn-helix domain-containing protein [Streptomyces sp. McG2]